MFDINNIEVLNNINLFFKFFNEMSDLVYLTKVEKGKKFRYVLANEPAMKLFGLTVDSFGKTINELLPHDVFQLIESKYEEAIAKKEPITYEDKVEVAPTRANSQNSKYVPSQVVYWESTITPVFNQDGLCTHLLAIVRNITDRKQKKLELKLANDRFKLLWNSVADAMYTFDKNERFISVNKSFEKLLGWTEEEILNDPTISIIPTSGQKGLREIIEEVKNGNVVPSSEAQRITKGGEIIDVLASYSPIYDLNGKWDGAVAVYKDISGRKQYEEELKKLALQDSLTGLPNRTVLFKSIKEEMERAKISKKTLSLLILDIDNFKEVNDTWGHDIGDELLKEFAKRVEYSIRENDLLARIGGDEFVILMADLHDPCEAVNIADRILQTFQDEWEIENLSLRISASIGISFYSDYAQDEKGMLKQADLALYEAKGKGRNSYQIYQSR
jgi:diguanylate cyclase (GGDEF)-like protein/PAS domain S-box-containing protein